MFLLVLALTACGAAPGSSSDAGSDSNSGAASGSSSDATPDSSSDSSSEGGSTEGSSGEGAVGGSGEASTNTFPFPIDFVSEDLYGNRVDAGSLGNKEAFFIYLWTTWCPSCVRAMPGLAQLSDEFGDRVGFISLLGDFGTARGIAQQITEEAGVSFITVDALLDDFEPLLELLDSGFVPTSVIVGGDGNMIGEQIVGSDISRFREALEYALVQSS